MEQSIMIIILAVSVLNLVLLITNLYLLRLGYGRRPAVIVIGSNQSTVLYSGRCFIRHDGAVEIEDDGEQTLDLSPTLKAHAGRKPRILLVDDGTPS